MIEEAKSAEAWRMEQQISEAELKKRLQKIEMGSQASDFLIKAGSFAVAIFMLGISFATVVSVFIVLIREAWHHAV